MDLTIAPFHFGGVLRGFGERLQLQGARQRLGGDIFCMLGEGGADLLRGGAVGIDDGVDPVRDLDIVSSRLLSKD